MFNLDPAKLLIIAVVAVILLGPDKLPQFARQVGGAWRSLNEFRHRMESDVRDHIPDLPSGAEIAHFARSPTALLNRLSTLGEGPAGEGDGTGAGDGPAANGTANGTSAVTNGSGDDHLPDGAPIEPFGSGTAPVPTPAATPHSSDVAAFGDPSLN
jgi:hypothetical protein